MNIKQLIRLIIKIPATPFVLVVHAGGIIGFTFVRFFEWVYDAPEWNKQLTKEIIQDSKKDLKKWFTTV